MNENIVSLIENHVVNTPDQIFNRIIIGSEVIELTYSELWQSACAFCYKLQKLDVKDGDIIGIMLPYGRDVYSAFLGGMMLGAIPSIFPQLSNRQDPAVFWESHKVIFKRTPIRHLIIDDEFRDSIRNKISGLEVNFISPISLEEIADISNFQIPSQNRSSDIALLQHSSGSTDVKKGVALSHHAILEQIEFYRKTINLSGGKGKLIASWLPLYHDMGLITGFLLPVITATPVVTLDPFRWVMRPTQLLQVIQDYKASHIWLPNFAYHHIMGAVFEGDNWDLSSLQFLINCSEPCKAETFQLFYEKFECMGVKQKALSTCYAMAETVFAVTQSPANKPVRSCELDGDIWLSSGTAISGVSIDICDSNGETLPEGEVGEIRLHCSYMFDSYWELPEKTASQLVYGKFYTRDVGFMDNGELFVIGRTDDVLNIRGRKFMANDLEFSVRNVKGIKKGRIVALSEFDPKMGSQKAVILAEKEEASGVSDSDLAKDIRLQLEKAVGLRIENVKIVPLGWLIKTTSGKMNRKLNAKKYRDREIGF